MTLWNDYIQPVVLDLASALVGLAITWIAVRVHAATGVTIEQKWQDDLHRAADTGVAMGMNKVGTIVAAEMNRGQKNAVIGEAVRWVNSSVPDALKGLGITPDKIASVVEAKLQNVITKNATPAISSLPSSASSANKIMGANSMAANSSAQVGLR